MNKISKWIIKKLGGYTVLPLPRPVVVVKEPSPPIKVVAEKYFPPGLREEDMMLFIASNMGEALLNVGGIKFEEVENENPYDPRVKYRGTVMAIRQE